MEFISAEEFLKQDKRIQKVFLDWWKPSVGDLIVYKYLFKCVDEVQGTTIRALSDTYHIFKNECVPLLTEGQLRKFIEDKGYFITFNATSNTYDLFNLKIGRHYKAFEYREKTILKTYWKVALEIVKEEI